MPLRMENPITMSLLAGCLAKRFGLRLIGVPKLFSSRHQPLPPGQKRVKEEWENIWYIGMFGSMAFAAVMLYYKPDTRYAFAHRTFGTLLTLTSIQTWALKEAKERMEARGERYKYEPSNSS